ncbi:hypothetical protein F52700_8639 [Fusarium sp. NRRL 52700]|nr:hypothetical protein F52700_8639 [Fusarium sp. NRRL 52700]
MSTVASPVAQRASLLGLPLELRDQVYYYYFKADGGYVSDGDKLLQASGQAVQISLMLACRSIARETQHLPFTLNTITFSTIYRPDWRKQAAALNQMAHYHLFLLQGMVLRLGRLLTPDMYEESSPEYSQYMPIVMEEVREFIRIHDRRTDLPLEVRNMSAFYNAQPFRDDARTTVWVASVRYRKNDSAVSLKRTRIYLLRQLADKHPTEFSKAIGEILPGWDDSHSIEEFFDLGFNSWAMPTRSEVKRMVYLMQMTSGYPDLNRATEVFSASMKPYIAWLTAHMTDCITQGLIAPSGHHEYPFPTRTSLGGVAPVSERSALIQCDFTLDQPWEWKRIYDESEVSGVSTLDRLSTFGMGRGDDFLDVTTDLLNWEKVLRENYETQELSEGVFAEPYNDRHLA